MIPDNIDVKHIYLALELVDQEGYAEKYKSTKHDLIHNGTRYPPKYIVSQAYKFVSGSPFPVGNFSGGDQTNNFLKSRGFSIVSKDGSIDGVSIQTESEEDSYSEGKKNYKIHVSYERDSKLAKRKKLNFFKKNGNLFCEICNFDFHKSYGERGYGFIECHHNIPVSEMGGETQVNEEDLTVLCSNCHRMIHRSKPWISVQDLKEIYKTQE